MNATDIFIRKPVLSLVLTLLIVVAGIQAIGTLTVRQYPLNENAVVTVTTVYTGADAELVRGFITTPLERAIASADGIDYLESTSSQGVSIINARLKLNQDATKALAEIGSKVDQVRGDLPPEAEVPVINIETADSRFASAYLRFTSDILAQNEITDYLVRAVQPRLTALPGVQRADILGARTFAMRIWLDPARMASLGVGPADVRSALAANNYLAAAGSTLGSLVRVNLAADTDLADVEEFKRLVVRSDGDRLIRLEDVAEVELGAENYDSEVRFSGETAVFMGIWTMPNANALDVMAAVRKEMEAVRRDLPSGMQAGIAYDATRYIDHAIKEVIGTLTETLLIVVAVIFLFLGSLRSVLVPVVSIPISLIGAVFLMQVFGFTINLLTLLAVVLSVGIVVDDAIVMVENIERHIRRGMKPFDAAIRGARELSGAVVAMTLTLAAVYTPIGLQGGLTGSLFREFAFTLAGAVLVSGVVALTLSPMMASRLLNEKVERRWLPAHINAGFEWFRSLYGRVLDASLAARPAVYTAWVVLSLLAVLFYLQSPRELAPTEDQGVVFGILETPADATIDRMSVFASQINDVYQSMPETTHTFQITEPAGGFAGMGLVPWGERERTAFEVLPEVQQKLAMVPGIKTLAVMPPALPGGGDFPVEFVIASTADPTTILGFAERLRDKAAASGLFAFPPIINLKEDQPRAEFVIDRDKVAAMGMDLAGVGGDIAAAVGGNFVNRFNMDGRSYKVIAQVERAGRLDAEQLLDLQIKGPDGAPVALRTVATLRTETLPRSLPRFQQLNAVKLSGVAIRPLDEALAFLEKEAASILPEGYTVDYTGESRQLRAEGPWRFLATFGFAVVMIFLVLSAQFNSFRDPLIILLGSVPLALFGALVFTFLKMPSPNVPFWTDGWTTTLNIYSQVGLVTLVGLIAKNGILIVEFANQLQGRGIEKIAAVRAAAMNRLRPILMTTLATVCGHFPLVLVTGAGAEARNSIGLVLVGGMAIGTAFALIIVPALYVLMAKDRGGTSTAVGDV
jgi:multidrug efflux pump